MGQDVSSLSFDDVMSVIIEASSPLDLVFVLNSREADESTTSSGTPEEEEEPRYKIGTDVLITVKQPESNKPDIVLTAKVGDNLRKALLSNKEIELYRGLKKKLGNCGGGGQCGFCAVELIDEEGCWGERSDYEEAKIGKKESDRCRLACLNTIVGPATVRTL
jgi:ferredoxin